MNAFPRASSNAVKRAQIASAVLIVGMLAGCTSTHQPTGAALGSSTSPSAAASPSATASSSPTGEAPSSTPTGAGSATPSASVATPPPAPASTPPTSKPSTPAPSGSGNCLSGTFAVVHPGTDNPVRSACLHLGTTVDIELLAIRGTTWSAPTDSNPSVATLTDQVEPIGTRHDHVTLLRTGTVTFTSTSTYNPDPHGPPSQLWSLTLTIVP